MSALLVYLLQRQVRKRKRDEELITNPASNLPRILVVRDEENVNEELYRNTTDSVNNSCWEVASNLLKDINPTLKHNELHFLSLRNMHVLCGLHEAEFSRLFLSVQKQLQIRFPKSPLCGDEDTALNKYGSLRLKLFITLYKLKLGNSYRELEVIFGWNHSTIGKFQYTMNNNQNFQTHTIFL
jgi:hypothetical protein